jgi:UDP-N-acetylmuramate--alanine ligase
VRNALAAIAAAMEMGIGFETIRANLTSFGGVKRRFEIIGSAGGVAVVDDYAHHPREIAATLAAARQRGYGRVIAVFQPHLYSRTRDFMDGFASSLGVADMLFVSEIYKSREEPLPGVSGAEIVARVKSQGGTHAFFVPQKETIVETIAPLLKQGDAVILMGAGDINEIAHPLLERIRHG